MSISINEGDVGFIKSREEIIMETWALAPRRILVLEILGRHLLLDNLINAFTNTFGSWYVV
jgi:hypothetical protein